MPYLELNPIVNVWGYSSPDMEPLIDTESLKFTVSRLVTSEVLGFAACIGGKAGLAADAITAGRQARIAARKAEWMNKQAEFTQRSIERAADDAKAALKPVKVEHKGYGGTKGFRSGIGGIHK